MTIRQWDGNQIINRIFQFDVKGNTLSLKGPYNESLGALKNGRIAAREQSLADRFDGGITYVPKFLPIRQYIAHAAVENTNDTFGKITRNRQIQLLALQKHVA